MVIFGGYDGSFRNDVWALEWARTVAVGDRATTPTALAFEPPRPNPTRAGVGVVFRLSSPRSVGAAVFDLHGRLVRTLASGQEFGPGAWSLHWDGRDQWGTTAPSGVYLLRFTAGSTSLARRFVVVR